MDRSELEFAKDERRRIAEEDVRMARKAKEASTLELADKIEQPLLKVSGVKEGTKEWDNVQDCAMMIARYADSVDYIFIQEAVGQAIGKHPRLDTMAQAILGVVEDHLKPAAPAAAPANTGPQHQAKVTAAPTLKAQL